MKRAFALMVGAVMLGGVLAGCGSQNGVAEDAAGDGGAGYSTGMQIGTEEDPVAVRILIPPKDDDLLAMGKLVEEGMAQQGQYVSLEFLEEPAGDYATALPLAIRTGQLEADIVYFQGGDIPLAYEGLLEDLTGYVANAEHVQNIMQEHNRLRMESYPYIIYLIPPRIPVPVVRADWFGKLETGPALLEDPTVENYHALFTEMVDSGMWTYAYGAYGNLDSLDSIFNHAFGLTDSVMQVDGVWNSSKISQEEKAKLEFYSQLYAEGLIDPEYLTTQWDGMEQKFYENTVGMIAGGAGGVTQIYNTKMTTTNGPESELLVLPPAKGVSQAYQSIDVTKEQRGMTLLADSEVKNAAFAVIDYMCSPEGRVIELLGIEGKHHTVADGVYTPTEQFPEWWSRFFDTTHNFTATVEPSPHSKAMIDSLAMLEEYSAIDTNVLVPEEMQANWDAMMALYREYAADIVRGIKPIGAFDDFVAEWNAAGGDKFAEYLAEEMNK